MTDVRWAWESFIAFFEEVLPAGLKLLRPSKYYKCCRKHGEESVRRRGKRFIYYFKRMCRPVDDQDVGLSNAEDRVVEPEAVHLRDAVYGSFWEIVTSMPRKPALWERSHLYALKYKKTGDRSR